ncbi:ATP-binding cassette domain-containing protein [Corynebacterium jeddahense]|uniref:HMP/thiamine import ATP-binding protein YkoD n=3 Tax=Corynebacterium jeddahense TaxID=1414719 RepID=A0ABY7UM35_9CORY|nr:ATP-binding cassette domain-containing protein [Corynebacterium jeddahense]WCZ38628.1 Putative HMP/thiamine import ATP-binding protein YkoD [Corynebacterium jeddahense]
MDLSVLSGALERHRMVQVVADSGAGLTTIARQVHADWPGAAVVQQDPVAHITYLRETVVEEVAIGLEQRGVPRPEMEQRCARVLAAAGLSDLAERHPARLSGGQTRRLAIACVAVLEPRILLLDDPLAGLDPHSATQVVSLLAGLPSRVVLLGNRPRELDSAFLTIRGGVLVDGLPEPHAPSLPPRLALDGPPLGPPLQLGEVCATRGGRTRRWWQFRARTEPEFTAGPVRLEPRPGGVLWLRGANGAGKTTLLRAMAGLDGNAGLESSRGVAVSLALQRAADQVAESTVGDFVAEPEAVEALGLDPEMHPFDLPAAGLRLAQLAQVFGQGRPLVLLDEPDVGLDAPARDRAHAIIASGVSRGQAVVLTCHDETFASEVGEYAPVSEVWLKG